MWRAGVNSDVIVLTAMRCAGVDSDVIVLTAMRCAGVNSDVIVLTTMRCAGVDSDVIVLTAMWCAGVDSDVIVLTAMRCAGVDSDVIVLTAMRCAGVDSDVHQHHHPQVPWLHEQRPDWLDCLPHPHATPALPHDWIHASHHRLPGLQASTGHALSSVTHSQNRGPKYSILSFLMYWCSWKVQKMQSSCVFG